MIYIMTNDTFSSTHALLRENSHVRNKVLNMDIDMVILCTYHILHICKATELKFLWIKFQFCQSGTWEINACVVEIVSYILNSSENMKDELMCKEQISTSFHFCQY